MKQFFSSLMIFNGLIFYSSLDAMQQLILTRYKEKIALPDLAACERILKEEDGCRKSLALSKNTKTKRQLHAKIDASRTYFLQLLTLQNPTPSELKNFLASYKLFGQFIKEQLGSHVIYQSTEQFKKDNSLLKKMGNTLCSIFNITDMVNPEENLTQSILCIHRYQSSSTSLLDLKKQKNTLAEQMQHMNTQMTELDIKIEFEELKQEFTKEELQKQQAIKVELERANQEKVNALNEQIQKLTQEREKGTQQLVAAQNRNSQINALLDGWDPVDSDAPIFIDDSAVV